MRPEWCGFSFFWWIGMGWPLDGSWKGLGTTLHLDPVEAKERPDSPLWTQSY
jgi:hypothetical protein